MNIKLRFTMELLLIIAAVAVLLYNFAVEKRVSYLASVVAVCGATVLLVRDLYRSKRP